MDPGSLRLRSLTLYLTLTVFRTQNCWAAAPISQFLQWNQQEQISGWIQHHQSCSLLFIYFTTFGLAAKLFLLRECQCLLKLEWYMAVSTGYSAETHQHSLLPAVKSVNPDLTKWGLIHFHVVDICRLAGRFLCGVGIFSLCPLWLPATLQKYVC